MDRNVEPNRFSSLNSSKDYFPWAAIGLTVILAVISLNAQGRVWWCQTGDYWPWSWDVWSTHNSQHIIDPYTFTHVLHGILEFWLLGLIFRKMPLVWRLFLAIFIESSWEVIENTDAIIQRYREATMSLDYFGDSIINSAADIVACGTGFLIAHKLRFWLSMALFLLTEIILILWIRDSLLINILMLIYPVEAIKQWQTAG